MEERFGDFFKDKNYIKIKNNLFNYINRKKQINKIFLMYYSSKKDHSFLDIGSGISPVSPIPKKTIFIDLSEDGIDILKKRGYNAEVGSITSIKKRNGSFDWVFCSEVLEHIEDYNKAISEMSRVLKTKGKLVVTVPVHMKYWNVDDEFVEHYRRFDPDKLKRDLEREGLRVIEMKPVGSILERYITLALVKIFKSTGQKPVSDMKAKVIILGNKLVYLLVVASLLFSSKKSTSIMLYLCEKS